MNGQGGMDLLGLAQTNWGMNPMVMMLIRQLLSRQQQKGGGVQPSASNMIGPSNLPTNPMGQAGPMTGQNLGIPPQILLQLLMGGRQ